MEPTKRPPIIQRIIIVSVIACFFLSGAVSLIYQTLWVRMFTMVFGNSSYAVSTVLCAFMAGLGLGSWLLGRRIDKKPESAILVYGFLEMGIALSALVFPFALRITDEIHSFLYTYLVASNTLLAMARFVLAFGLLIVPTTLMGGTLPVLVRFFVRRRETLGAGVGALYAANTFGAVVGCFIAGFYLIGVLGVTGAMTWNLLANFSVALAAIALYYFADHSLLNAVRVASSSKQETASLTAKEKSSRYTATIILCFAALAGMTSLAYEVFWTRVLVFYMNNSTYAFSSMLATLLLGLAIGGYLFGKIADRAKDLWMWFAGIEFIIGLWAIFAFPVFDPLFHRLADSSKLFEANYWGAPAYVKIAKSAMLMLVPTLLMGATFPLLTKLYARNMGRLGRSIGNIYSRNTLGSMAGAFVAGFVLIPLLGIQKGIIATAMVNVGLALAAAWMSEIPALRKKALLVTMVLVAVVTVVVTPKRIFFHRRDEIWAKLLFYREDNTATVKVYELPAKKRVISINGYQVAGDYVLLNEIQQALGHYPMLLHANPKTALVIGFGAGGTSWAIGLHRPERIDLVEIVPAILETAPYLEAVNHGILRSPNFHVVIDDGRNYIHATEKTYDVITVDSIDPKHAGNGNLYAVEFYRDCLRKLNPGGIMAQWVPYHLLTERELKIILKSFTSVFPHYQLWFTPMFNYFILMGSSDDIILDYTRLTQKFLIPSIAKDLKSIAAVEPAMFVNTFAMDEASIECYVRDTVDANTYDRPRIEFYSNYDYRSFGQLPISAPMGKPTLANLGKTNEDKKAVLAALAAHRQVAQEMVEGDYFLTRKEYSEAAEHLRNALMLDPKSPSAFYMVQTLEGLVKEEVQMRIASLNRDLGNPASFFELGQFYEKVNKPDLAIHMYWNAIEVKPDFDAAYTSLALIYGDRGDYDTALTMLETALQINPRSLLAAYNAGVAYYLKGDYSRVESVCYKALSYPAVAADEQLRKDIQEMLELVRKTRMKVNAKALFEQPSRFSVVVE